MYYICRTTCAIQVYILHVLHVLEYQKKHLEYQNAHCPGAAQFIIQRVKEPKDNLHFLYMSLHLCIRLPVTLGLD